MGTGYSINNNSELKRSNVKLQAQQVSAFNGNAIKWRSWKKRTRAAIGTAGMLDILDSADYAESHPADNETVFHLLQVATADGNAAHLVDAFEDQKDGHAAYNQLMTWYEGDEMTTETAEDVRAKLDRNYLNTRTTASEYINYFQQYTKQLKELGESYTESKTVQIFLNQITDPDYENTKELCIENKCKVDECIERVRAKERRLSRDKATGRTKSLNVRRLESNDNNNPVNPEDYINQSGFYSFPKDKWYQFDEQTQKKIKKYNSDLRKKRKSERRNQGQENQNSQDQATNRNIHVDEPNNDGESPTKKLRSVSFKDSDQPDQQDDQELRNVTNRRSETISFQVQEE